jgi:hypothetical protein
MILGPFDQGVRWAARGERLWAAPTARPGEGVRRGCCAAPRKRANSVKPLGLSENHRLTPERLAQDRAMRSASPRVAQPNWSGPGTAQMAYDGVAAGPLLWMTTSPVSGMLSGMAVSERLT